MSLLSTHGLTARYGDFQALFGIDIAIEEGQSVALANPPCCAASAVCSRLLRSRYGWTASLSAAREPTSWYAWALPWCLKAGGCFPRYPSRRIC